MKRSLFTLALAGVAAAAALPASALVTSGIGGVVVDRGVFNIAQAYPCTIGTYGAGIQPVQTYCGNVVTPITQGAAPGILSLKRTSNFQLDVNCFAVTPPNEFNCVVQAYRLFKMVPGSFKCPDVYGLPHFNADGVLQPYTYIQFGTGVRTWWSLNFTQPGTRFLLEVVSACQSFTAVQTEVNAAGQTVTVFQTRQVQDPAFPNDPTKTITEFVLDAKGNKIPVPLAGAAQTTRIHLDQWRWRVVIDADILLNVIELMHGGAVSTLEVPCILGEDMYAALVTAQGNLRTAINDYQAAKASATDLTDFQKLEVLANRIFDFEALIVANCLFVEVLNPLVAFPGPDQFGAPNIQPPGNLAQTVFFGAGSAVAGIIDTIENPCCCKLLVDLEALAIINDVIGQTPTLPKSIYGL